MNFEVIEMLTHLKSVQNDLDKYHHDKCYLDKCPKHIVSFHFSELRLHAKFQLPRLCRGQKKDVLQVAGGGWVGGWFLVENNATLWLHLAS